MIETNRLLLRQWQEQDRAVFAQLCADPLVMKYFNSTLTRAQSNESVDRFSSSIERKGWGFWAAELKADATVSNSKARLIGFIGLNTPQYELPFSPCVEIGWRLARDYWGYGYASEGAAACLQFAFEDLALAEVVSMTPVQNTNSEKVMQRIGMSNSGQNFHHPALSLDHELGEHLLYRISAAQWRQRCEN